MIEECIVIVAFLSIASFLLVVHADYLKSLFPKLPINSYSQFEIVDDDQGLFDVIDRSVWEKWEFYIICATACFISITIGWNANNIRKAFQKTEDEKLLDDCLSKHIETIKRIERLEERVSELKKRSLICCTTQKTWSESNNKCENINSKAGIAGIASKISQNQESSGQRNVSEIKEARIDHINNPEDIICKQEDVDKSTFTNQKTTNRNYVVDTVSDKPLKNTDADSYDFENTSFLKKDTYVNSSWHTEAENYYKERRVNTNESGDEVTLSNAQQCFCKEDYTIDLGNPMKGDQTRCKPVVVLDVLSSRPNSARSEDLAEASRSINNRRRTTQYLKPQMETKQDLKENLDLKNVNTLTLDQSNTNTPKAQKTSPQRKARQPPDMKGEEEVSKSPRKRRSRTYVSSR